MENLIIKGGKIFTPLEVIENGVIIVEGKKIVSVSSETEMKKVFHEKVGRNKYRIINAKGMLISPGFIEIHRHGLDEWDVLNAGKSDLEKIARALLRQGVTAFLPTIMTAPLPSMKRCAGFIRGAMFNTAPGSPKAEILGIHLEGPYLCHNKFRQRCGVTDIKRYVRKPSIKDFDENFGEFKDIIRMVTLAPEEAGAMTLLMYLSRKGIVCAAGHSNADFKEMQKASEKGLRHVTHIFNGMPSLHHREPGIIGTALQDDRIMVDLIADGVHVSEPVMKILFRIKRKSGIVLITDGIKKFTLPKAHKELLGGSWIKMNRVIANVVALGIPVKDAIKMATANPARLIGVNDRLGSLSSGKDADIILMDDNLKVKTVIVKGNIFTG